MENIYLIKYEVFFTLFLSMIFSRAFSQELNPNYDQELATNLGADEYGMKYYVLVILKPPL